MNADAADLAPVRAPSSRAGTLEQLAWCARREVWEHRALWIAPLAVQALLAVCLALGQVNLDMPLPESAGPEQLRVAIFTILLWTLAQPVFITATICVSFYLLDALYAERKDRSILFWKSLPVSDELTVASKFAVAAVVVPLGAFLLATVGGLLFTSILAVRVPEAIGWDTREWLRTEVVLLLEAVLGVLWYAPLGAALLLLSSWVRKGPVMWATLVSLAAPLAELVAFRTHYIWKFEQYRLNGIWHKIGAGHEKMFDHFPNMPPIGRVLEVFDWRAVFTDLDLWLGVVVAIALVYAAARVRRFRDDT